MPSPEWEGIAHSHTADRAVLARRAGFNGRAPDGMWDLLTYLPVPVMAATGALPALDWIFRVRTTVPTATGEKVTLSLHVLPTRTGVAHVPRLTVNGAPTNAAVMTSGLAPVLVTSTVLVTLVPRRTRPKPALAIVAVVVAVTAWPVPERATNTVGATTAFVAITTDARRTPVALGVKVTSTVHVTAGANGATHVLLVIAKLVAFTPVIVTDSTTRSPEPVLVTSNDCAAEVVLTVRVANVSDPGMTVTSGATPVPPNETVRTGFTASFVVIDKVADLSPSVVGLNPTEMVHDAPEGIAAAHPLTTLNEVGSVVMSAVPPRSAESTSRSELPTLVTTTL